MTKSIFVNKTLEILSYKPISDVLLFISGIEIKITCWNAEAEFVRTYTQAIIISMHTFEITGYVSLDLVSFSLLDFLM